MKPVAFAFAAAADAAGARRHLAEEGAKLMAGGQSLGPMLNLRLVRPVRVVDISGTGDLREAREEADAVVYGAAVTHAEIEDGAVPDATPGWLPAIARRIAYRAVRNRGTIGGSLVHADPAADWLVTLTALGAAMELVGPDGTRRLPLQDFVEGPFTTALAPGEIVTGVRVPRRAAGARWGYYKFQQKVGEFAQASAAVLVDPVRGERRIVVGAVEGKPLRLADPDAVLADPSAVGPMLLAALPPRRDGWVLHAEAVRRAVEAAS